MTQKNKKSVKKKSLTKNVGFYFAIIYVVLTVLFLFQIFLLNIVPMKYAIPLAIVLVLIAAGLAYLQLGKHMNKVNKILGKILIVLLSVLLGVGNWYMFKTSSAFAKMTGADTDTSVVSVVVMKDSSYESMKDLTDKKLGTITIGDMEVQSEALTDVNKEANMEQVNFASFDKFGDALYNNEVDAILVNESNRGSFEDKHPNFESETRVIKQYTYTKEAKDLSKNVNVTKESFSVYITGIDTYGTIATVSRSDVNMIATVNPKTRQVLLTSIPRDYYVPQTCQGNQKDKLTHTGIYGVSCTIDTTEQFMNIDINYYARVNFSSLVEIVDALGGVTVNSPNAFTSLHGNYNIVVGENYLDGNKALGFVRERYSLPGGDRDRGKNQMLVLSAIIEKATSPAIITGYASIMDAVGGTFQTNMSQGEMNSLIKMQLSDMSGWNIKQFSLNGIGETNWSPANGFNSYVMEPDQATVQTATSLINKVINGEVLSDADVAQ
ncbi:LCP family protein [Amedibacillus sp. YH-ame10]